MNRTRIDLFKDLRRISSAMMHGMPCSVFFQPTDEFIHDICEKAGKRRVIDVGTGTGMFARKLIDAGLNVVPIDIVAYENTIPELQICDGTTFPYEPGDLVVIARPCRGEWIEDTIAVANSAGAEVIYISKPTNLPLDVHSEAIDVAEQMAKVGMENEVALIWQPHMFPQQLSENEMEI